MPTVASNCALVAPHFTAIAMPWMISPASGADHVRADARAGSRVDARASSVVLLVAAGERVRSARKRRAVDVDRAVARARRRLGQPDGCRSAAG